MIVKELRDKLASESEVWISKQIKATKEMGGDINLFADGSMIAWIPNSALDSDEVESHLRILSLSRLANLFVWSNRLGALAESLEIRVNGTSEFSCKVSEEVERRESINELRLSGMVEAYEKIVIGRELNVSR